MTEQEWLRSWDIRAMVAALRGKGTGRIWRLFAIACAQRRVDSMRDLRSVRALEVARRFADGAATRGELLAARAHAEAAERQARNEAWDEEARSNFHWTKEFAAALETHCAARAALQCVVEDFGAELSEDFLARAENWLAPDMLREIFGNPFRWTMIDPAWLSLNEGAAGNLAQQIYDDSAFDQLAILADALEDAGCSDEAILSHLRSPGPHVRGCWAVDLVLGKA